MNQIVKLHGIPKSIVSDRDKVFVSSFWKSLFQLQGTSLNMSSNYHPQTNEQAEVVNRTLEQYLRCFTHDQPKKWMDLFAWAEYSYNTAKHSTTGFTPFEAVYGIPPPNLLTYVSGTTKVKVVDDFLHSRKLILEDLRQHLVLAQNRMKVQADQHCREPYRQHSVAFRNSLKLSPRFYGPFKILARIGEVAYRLELPTSSQIHDVFYVSLLKRHIGSTTQVLPQLPPVTEDSVLLSQPESILNTKVIQKGRYRPKEEILVKWAGAHTEDATWENKWRFLCTYPTFHP
ncbi:hypothetical protein ACOSQ2_009775 [Xanthoceras sorbifolium]